jgi:hypothetical protein
MLIERGGFILLEPVQPIHFDFAGKLPIFNVSLDGVYRKFVFDSGSPYMVLNSQYEDNGAASVMPSLNHNGVTNMRAKLIASFEWGTLRLVNQLAMISDISHLEECLNTTVHGLIGCAQFMNYDLLIDYNERRITLTDSYGKPPDEMISAIKIPFVMSNHVPVVSVKVGDRTLSLGLDTGASENAISKAYKDCLNELMLLYDFSQEGIFRFNTEDTEHEACLCYVKNVVIGDRLTIDGMRFAFHDINIPDVKAEGLLGYELFCRYKTLIRFVKRELLLQPLGS